MRSPLRVRVKTRTSVRGDGPAAFSSFPRKTLQLYLKQNTGNKKLSDKTFIEHIVTLPMYRKSIICLFRGAYGPYKWTQQVTTVLRVVGVFGQQCCASVCTGLKVLLVSNYTQQVPTLLWFHANGRNMLGPMLRVIVKQCCVR